MSPCPLTTWHQNEVRRDPLDSSGEDWVCLDENLERSHLQDSSGWGLESLETHLECKDPLEMSAEMFAPP